MIKRLWILLPILLLLSCTMRATKNGDTMTLMGLSQGSAVWPDGSKIVKGKVIPVPDLIPSDGL